ncbi:unnamed protein product [Chondrus crispus]|uniref:Uncharacterized protein n=1 Tax=Chondrus crispus TaxID=2769 RepID=R7Q6G8_CHOCR|nr:unnamed protein product [Chondrus crispus]CDF34137.1 unnamed protein product [Chondrus crispus]|eukprot:XP_005713956.1 unnamed protein product [Chondrus crispus]
MFCASEDAVDSFSTLVTKDERFAQRSPEPEDEKPQGPMGTPADMQSIPEPLCVDAEALTNADVQMVYRKHFYAKVLCDSERSCATAAHMVVWRGVAMMMRSYCQRVQCEETALHVNSPRYKKKVRIQSRTEGLQFTAFAARYGTKAEELAIGVAVRLGL